MAKHVSMLCRTVNVVRPYTSEVRVGNNGQQYESKMIMFTVATDREYKSGVRNQDGSFAIDENGNIQKERKTDFYVIRATGPIAENLAKYCTSTKIVDGQEKLISRRLLIQGHDETYKKSRVINGVQVNLGGKLINIDGIEVPETPIVTVVDGFELLDANPAGNAAQGTQGAAVAQATATPVAQAAPQAVVAQAAPAAPVVNAQAGNLQAPF